MSLQGKSEKLNFVTDLPKKDDVKFTWNFRNFSEILDVLPHKNFNGSFTDENKSSRIGDWRYSLSPGNNFYGIHDRITLRLSCRSYSKPEYTLYVSVRVVTSDGKESMNFKKL
eukprot:GHVP01027639.1.p1 GENE.GHVP01027639.1~~GHVP01027639.1.p1  ORF type:complete len:128 (-),score=18.35 GHVP01027639.1:213-551(-)